MLLAPPRIGRAAVKGSVVESYGPALSLQGIYVCAPEIIGAHLVPVEKRQRSN